ncbi:MAG: AAA family ATPase [Maricaulaceae bacterium]
MSEAYAFDDEDDFELDDDLAAPPDAVEAADVEPDESWEDDSFELATDLPEPAPALDDDFVDEIDAEITRAAELASAPPPPAHSDALAGSGLDLANFMEMLEEDPGEVIPPVPRITVEAFCERAETAALMHHCAADRRLSRAHIGVQSGGLSAAIERFHDESTPNLVLVESGMRGRGLFDQLDELANVCEPDTKVIVIGAANDISLYRELMRRGVSEYLVPPMAPVHVIRAISTLYADPETPFAGKLIAFVGARGGSGSSTVAHNTAWCIAEATRSDATIIDFDLPFGTAGLDFNQDVAQGVADALDQPDRIDDVLLERLLVRCTDRLTLLAAPATLDKDWEVDAEAFEQVVETVRATSPFVVLDMPHTWSRAMRAMILASDEVVLTATPELASLRNAKNLFDLLKAARPNDAPPKLVLNQVGMPKRPEIPVKDFAEALGVEPALVLPFDPQLFGAAANNGQMIAELKPDAKAAEGFTHLAAVATGRTAVSRPKSMFEWFTKRRS